MRSLTTETTTKMTTISTTTTTTTALDGPSIADANATIIIITNITMIVITMAFATPTQMTTYHRQPPQTQAIIISTIDVARITTGIGIEIANTTTIATITNTNILDTTVENTITSQPTSSPLTS